MINFLSSQSLKGRALKGGLVALSGFGASQGIRLASNLLMTRLLAPDAFALMGIAVTIQIWLMMMNDIGLDASIIRSKGGENPKFLATAFTLQAARNALIAVILVILALLLPDLRQAQILSEGSVFDDPRLPAFLLCIALSVLITGFATVRIALHNRALRLFPVIRLEIGAQLAGIAGMVFGAVNGLGAYSLAIGAIVAASVKTAGSYLFLKGPAMRFGLDQESFREIFDYGKWLMIASTFGFLLLRGDQIIFGWLFDITSFGLYSIATIWILSSRAIVELVQRRVTYPAFSEIHRDRPGALTHAYRRMRLVYEAGCCGLFLGLFLFSDLIIGLLYTEEYHGVSRYIKLLSVSMLLLPYRLLSSIILTSGDSRRFTIITMLPGVLLFIVTPVVYFALGEEYAIVIAALSPMLAIPLNWRFAKGFIRIDYMRECAMAAVALAAACLVILYD